MSSFIQSVSSAISDIFPHIDMQEAYPATMEDIQEINDRISMVNQLLIGVLHSVNQDPYFWRRVDCKLFAKTMEENKQGIAEMRKLIQSESRTLALLDSMQSNIAKLEKSLKDYPQFNFDLDRMKAHIECGTVSMPDNLKTAEEVMEWLLQQD